MIYFLRIPTLLKYSLSSQCCLAALASSWWWSGVLEEAADCGWIGTSS